MRIDRQNDTADDDGSVNITSKLRLFHKKYVYKEMTDVTVSVAYETELDKSINAAFSSKNIGVQDIVRHADKIYRTRSYYLYLRYHNRIYRFRMGFRQFLRYRRTAVADNLRISHITTPYPDYEVDVECEDTIEVFDFRQIGDDLSRLHSVSIRHVRTPHTADAFNEALSPDRISAWTPTPMPDNKEFNLIITYIGLSKIIDRLGEGVVKADLYTPDIINLFNKLKPIVIFPSNEQKALIWTNTIKKIQPSYMPLKTSMICSAHFKSSDYNLNCKKIRLNDNAVPTSRKSLMNIFEDLPKDINIDIPKYLQYDGHKNNNNTKVNETISNTAECSEASTGLKYNLSTSDNTKVNETISNTAECSEASTGLKYNLSTSDNTKVNETISNTAECSEASTGLKYNLSTSVIRVADNMLTSPLITRT
ncbi:hypothetical protein ACI65C_006871 [Semiaphis heraclei]